jgi:hypothetical protein
MILDARDRLVMFGGDGAGMYDPTVWILPLSGLPLRWEAVFPAGPGPGVRARHGAAYSALTNRMVVFGGEGAISPYGERSYDYVLLPAETWEMSLDDPVQWLRQAPAPGGSVPLPESGGPLVADAVGRRAWLVPGDQGFFVQDPSVWSYDFIAGGWTRALSAAGGPGLCAGAAACFARSSAELVLVGGAPWAVYGVPSSPSANAWTLKTVPEPSWSPAVPSPTLAGSPAYDPRALFDTATRRLITWNRDGVWSRDVGGDGSWVLSPVAVGEGPPGPDALSVIDPVRRRLLVFGGLLRRAQLPADRLWIWPLDGPAKWTSASTSGEPPLGAWGTQCAYDPQRDRVVVLPSSLARSVPLDTVAVLELGSEPARWKRIATEGGPPPGRSNATVLIDSRHDRLVLLSGGIPGPEGTNASDLWTLSLAGTPTWTGSSISWRSRFRIGGLCGLGIDPTLDRLMLIGGRGLSVMDFGDFSPLLSTSLGDPTSWIDLDQQGANPMRGAGTAFFDAAADRMLWWNGSTLWEITWPLGTPTAYGPATVVANEGRVHVLWPAPVIAPYAAFIERSVDGGRIWAPLTSATPLSDGSLAFTDSTPPASGAVAYRAVIERGGSLRVLGTASLALGAALPAGFTLAAARPNPTSGDIVVELASPADAEITLELFDLAGRRVGAVLHRRMPAGRESFTVSLAAGLAPGVYLLRAGDGSTTTHTRLAVVR